MPKKVKDLIAYIKTGASIITVNKRLSRYICRRYDEEMKDGHTCWKTPLILPLFSWMDFLWRESWPDKPLLSSFRAGILWKRIVSCDTQLEKSILLTRGAAGMAYEAYSLIKDYDISFPPEDIYLTEEAKALRRWTGKYEEALKKLGFIDHISLVDNVIQLIKNRKISVPEKLVFAGFDEISPKTASLVKVIKRSGGGEVIYWPHEPEPDAVIDSSEVRDRLNIRAYQDEVEEVIQAARWVRKIIRPGMKIGIIAPELDKYRSIIKREFAAELDPESILPGKNAIDLFNISLGTPLYKEPIIKAAIDVLSIDESRQDIEKISSILRSPFFLSEIEYFELSRIDAQLKDENRLNVSLFEVRNKTENIPSLSNFNIKLDRWVGILKKEDGIKKLPGYWAKNFNDLFKELGWPVREYKLSSAEYQTFEAWKKLLESFASLDDILGKVFRSEAVSQLAMAVKETLHQPESPECPIQVLGTLEATGIEFDHIWIMGAHEDAFPGQPSPNPFVPLLPQEKFKIPHFTPERELSFSKIIMKRLIYSAPRCEVSYPEIIDEKETKLSPLFKPFGQAIEKPVQVKSARLKDAIHSHSALEEMPVEKNIPVTVREIEEFSGGASLLKNQAACPFKAFAVHRLHACEIASPEPGFDFLERGSIVHRALELFWEKLKDSVRLNKIAETGELDIQIKNSVDAVMKKHYRLGLQPGKYLDLETERIVSLLRKWMDVELKRENFTVKEREAKQVLTLEDLVVRLYIDRVDQTDKGRRALIDYKTGKCNKYDWLTDRPKEPQMLLYSLTDNFDAIAYANIKSDEVKFIGIARDNNILPGIKSFDQDKWTENMENVNNWDDLKKTWKDVLVNIVRRFKNGEMQVDPNRNWKGNDLPCTYCGLTPLCRIYEAP